MTRFCENCGAPIPDGAAFCAGCGTPVAQQPAAPVQPAAPAQKRCPSCGAELSPGELFCAECGARADAAPSAQPQPTYAQPYAQQPAVPVQPAAPAQKRCPSCGAELSPGELFCAECGARADAAPSAQPQPTYAQPYAQQPAYTQPAYSQPAYPQQPSYVPSVPQQQKKGKGLLIGLLAGGAALLIALVLVGGFVWPGFFKSAEQPGNEPAATSAQNKPAKPTERPTTPPETEPIETETEPVVTTAFVNPFTDMEEDEYYYDAFAWAYQNGIVSGGETNADRSITRAEAVTFLWRSQGSPEPSLAQSPFTDLNPEKYYYKPALWAFEQGLVSTSSTAEFKPTDPLSQAQAITFLFRLMGGSASSDRQYFADVPQGKWYSEPVAWGVENGVLDYGGWYFYPEDETWRGDFILWLARAMGAEVEEAWYEEPEPGGLSLSDFGINLDGEGSSAYFHGTRSEDDYTVTNLKATVVGYDVFTEADGYPLPEEGYEYRRLRLRVDAADDSAEHGNYVIWFFMDYYYPDLRTQSVEEQENDTYTSLVYYKEKLWPITYWQSCEIRSTYGDMDGSIYGFTVLATVPKGYDGLVFGLESPTVQDFSIFDEEADFTDNYVMFRMD